MITRQHSEALAVWALRSGVWDYFVKPVPDGDLRKCLESLAQLPIRGNDQQSRNVLKQAASLPAETRFRGPCDPQEDTALENAIAYVERNLSQKIAQSAVARECQMSIWQFSRQFRKCFGTTFQEYVQQRRMMEAVKLLKNPSASVTDVCFAVGFVDPSYFTRVFRRFVGMSPSCYKDHLNDVSAALETDSAPVLAK
jgi:AraC-like DNA-binding protein